MPYMKELNKEASGPFLIELCFDVLRHFLSNDSANILRNALKEKYPGSFPAKTMEMVDFTVSDKDQKRIQRDLFWFQLISVPFQERLN